MVALGLPISIGVSGRSSFPVARILPSLIMNPSPFVLAADFRALGLSIRSVREPLEKSIKEVAIKSIKENFRTESYSPDGNRIVDWTQLHPATQQIRASTGYGPAHLILQRTRKLYSAATAFARWRIRGPDGVAYVQALTWPARAHYGPLHQSGTSKMPARPFMNLRPGDEDKIQRIFNNYIGRRVAQAGWTDAPISP